MSFSWLNLKKSKNNSNLRSRFFAPELLALENRVNPTAFTANVFYNIMNDVNTIQVQLTSTGIGANANTVKVFNSFSTISFDAGLGNTLQLNDLSGKAVVTSTGPAQVVSITTSPIAGDVKGLELIGNLGQDKFTLNDLNVTPISANSTFGISINTSSFSGANNQDTLTIDGLVNVIGDGVFKTSNSVPTQNLDQIIITSSGQINAGASTGSILLVANQGGTSNIDISSRTDLAPSLISASGSVNLLAGQSINIEGKAVSTNGGEVNFLSAVNLKNDTDLGTGNTSADITFSSTVDGNSDLNIDSKGILNFNGLVGSRVALNDITTDNISGLNVENNITANSLNTNSAVSGNIVFNGLQNYLTTLPTKGLNLVTTSNGNITINGAITMFSSDTVLSFSHDGILNINANIINGNFTENPVGTNSTVNIGDTASVNIYSNADITFKCPVFLKTNVSLEATNDKNITFISTLDGPGSLSVNCTGDLTFSGKVGSTTSLGSIDTRLVGLRNFKTSDPRSLTFSSTLNVGSINAIIQGDVSMKGAQVYSGAGLSLINLTSNSTIELGKISSNANNASNVYISNAGTLILTDDIIIGGSFSQSPILAGVTLTNGGSNYTSYPDVTITSNPADTGSGASAKASLGISSLIFDFPATGQATLGTGANAGTLTSIVPLSLGSGYVTPPPVNIDAPLGANGIQATAIAILGTGAQSGQVVSYTITEKGSGYTLAPKITVGSLPATAKATLGGVNSDEITSILPSFKGSGYVSPPSVTILPASTDTTGSGATAIAVLGTGAQAGQVVSYTITNPGSGYTTVPTIKISEPPKSISEVGKNFKLDELVTLQGESVSNLTSAYAATAKVTSISSNGAILGLDLLNPGKYDYLTSPNGLSNLKVVPLTGSAGTGGVISAVGFVNAVELVSSGSGYVSAPTVSFSGGNGSGAAALASLITPTGEVICGVSGSTLSIKIKTGFADSITFTTRLNLKQHLTLDSSTSSLSNITLGGIEDDGSSTLHNLTLIAGGLLQFNGTIGGVNPIGAIDASSNTVSSVIATSSCLGISASSFKVISSGDITLTCPQVYSGKLSSSGTLFFGLDLTNKTTNSSVNLGEIDTIEIGNSIKNSVRINNAGALNFNRDINIHGDFIQTGIGPVTFGDSSIVSSIGATATAVLTNGTVSSLVSNVIGAGYTSVPAVTISKPYVYQATAKAQLLNGTVSSVDHVFTSNFYSSVPLVTIEAPSGPGIRATATAILGTGTQAGQVVGYTITNPGSGYLSEPKVTVEPAGVQAKAIAELGSPGLLGGSVVAYDISGKNGTNQGVGYIPPVTISGGGGTGARAIAILGSGVTAGQVIGFTMVDSGSGYTSSPTITIASPLSVGTQATASAVFGTGVMSGKIIGLNVTNPGSGYVPSVIVDTPKIQLNTSGGDVSLEAGISLVQNLDINSSNNTSQSGNITFNRTVDSLTGRGLSLTAGPSMQGLKNGDISLKGSLGIGGMGDISINNPYNFSILGNVVGNSLVINSAGGSVIFSGTLDTRGTTFGGSNTSLSIQTIQSSGSISFQQPVTAAGNVIIDNAGSFITSLNGDISSSGGFSQLGAGQSFLSGDIVTTNGGITFGQTVNFAGKPVFNARDNSSIKNVADIYFVNGVNGTGGVSLEATGKIVFKENIGLLNPLSTIEIVNASFVEFNNLESQTLNASKILLNNIKGSVIFFGKTNIIDTMTTVSNPYSVEFKSDFTVGSNVNFLNNGDVTFLGNTKFLGSAFFNNSGNLNLRGNKLNVFGTLNVQSKIELFTNLDLFLGSVGNTFGGALSTELSGLSGLTINLNKGSNLVLTANSSKFHGSINLLGDSTSTSTLQIISSYSNSTIILNGGKLTGTGKVKEVQNVSGGVFNPGSPLGTFSIGAGLSLGSNDVFVTQINGATTGSFGQVSVTGSVSLGNSILNIPSASNLFVGQKVMLVNNGSANPINGQFNGLVEGASVTSGPVTFTISYKGGSGNDVVLTVTNVVVPAQPPTFYATGVDYGGGSVVQINYFNGTNLSFFAYSPAYTGGVRVALGDVNGDGYNDLITGTGVGGGPHIKVFNMISGRPVEIASFFAFEPNFMGGVYVASGDINGDGFDDIIIGAGAGGGPRVKVIRGASGYSMNSAIPLMDIFAYDPSFTGGVRVAAGNRDNVAGEEVITAAGYGGGPNIRSFSAVGQVIDNFFAFNPNINTGIFVGAGYVDGDGIADIIAGTGYGAPTQIAGFFSTGSRPTALPFTSSFMGGSSVGVALNSSGKQVFAAATGPSGSPVICLLDNSLVTTDSFFAINPLFSGGLFLNTSL